MFRIEMESTVKDTISGLAGIVTGRCEFVTGCRQYIIQPKATKISSMPDSCWIDEDRLIVLKTKKPMKPKNSGGPQYTQIPK